jgi:DNA/RNA-binding domain of Phe-tRNA-synthetase-like protein
MPEIRINKKIFEQYPTFRRGIVVARNIDNQEPSRELEDILNNAVSTAALQPVDLKTDPRTLAWNDAHRQFGSNPNKFPPAHCALLKRVQKPGVQLPLINKVVAIMNINSIRDIIPVGGDDVMRAAGSLELCYADGSESFTPLGNPDTKEQPIPGEVIYVVSESKVIVMNIDGLGDGSEARSIATRDRVAQMLEAYCQAVVTRTLLSPDQPTYRFDI